MYRKFFFIIETTKLETTLQTYTATIRQDWTRPSDKRGAYFSKANLVHCSVKGKEKKYTYVKLGSEQNAQFQLLEKQLLTSRRAVRLNLCSRIHTYCTFTTCLRKCSPFSTYHSVCSFPSQQLEYQSSSLQKHFSAVSFQASTTQTLIRPLDDQLREFSSQTSPDRREFMHF